MVLGDFFAGGAFEEFVDESLIGLGLFGGHAAKLIQETWGDTDGNQVLGVTGDGAADATGAEELLVGCFRNIGKVQLAIGRILDALYALPVAR